MSTSQRTTTSARAGNNTCCRKIIESIDVISKILGAIAGIGVIVLVLLVTNDVVMRYLFNRPTSYGLEISSYLLLFITMLSMPYTLFVDRHIRVDMLIVRLSKKVQLRLELFAFFVCLLFGSIMTLTTGQIAIEAYQEGWRSTSQLMVLMFPVYAIMPLGFGLFSVQCICKAYRCYLDLLNRTYEDTH